jgi:hypothetical protein
MPTLYRQRPGGIDRIFARPRELHGNKESTSFSEEKEAKRLFYAPPGALARSSPCSESKEVFCFFFSKKKCFHFGGIAIVGAKIQYGQPDAVRIVARYFADRKPVAECINPVRPPSIIRSVP